MDPELVQGAHYQAWQLIPNEFSSPDSESVKWANFAKTLFRAFTLPYLLCIKIYLEDFALILTLFVNIKKAHMTHLDGYSVL